MTPELEKAMRIFLDNSDYLKRLVDYDGWQYGEELNKAIDILADEIEMIIDKEND